MSCNICAKDVAKSLTDPPNVMQLINYLHFYVCACLCNYAELRVFVQMCFCLHTAAARSLRSPPAPSWNLIFCLLGSFSFFSFLCLLSCTLHVGAETLRLHAWIIGCNCLFASHLSHTQLSSVLVESSHFTSSGAAEECVTAEGTAHESWGCKCAQYYTSHLSVWLCEATAVFMWSCLSDWVNLQYLNSHKSRFKSTSALTLACYGCYPSK